MILLRLMGEVGVVSASPTNTLYLVLRGISISCNKAGWRWAAIHMKISMQSVTHFKPEPGLCYYIHVIITEMALCPCYVFSPLLNLS